MSKDRFFKAYSNLPEPEREQVIAVIEGKPYSWNIAFTEISNSTKLGEKILKMIEALGLI